MLSELKLPHESWAKLCEGYLVSSQGRVFSLKRNILLSQDINTSGYNRFRIGKKHYFVHIKVVELFGDCNGNYLPEGGSLREKGISIDHVDGNKRHNNVDNLEIVTHVENCLRRSAKARKISGIEKEICKHGGLKKCDL